MARGKRRGSVEGLKEKLYSRVDAPEVHPEERTPLPQTHTAEPVPVVWEEVKKTPPVPPPPAPHIPPASFHGGDINALTPMKQKKRISFATKFFLFSLAFFSAGAGVAAYVFFLGGNTISPQNIDMQIIAPSLIDGGKETSFQILVHNRNQAALQLADLVIDYPDGARDPKDQTKSLMHERQNVGSVASGQQIKRTASAVFYGQEGSPQKVRARLEYSIPGSNAIFEKQVEADFTVGSSPISISVSAPSKATTGEQFDIELTVQSNAATAVDNVVIQAQYPFGYSVVRSTPVADAGGTLWRLGTIEPGAGKKIRLVGKIEGQDGDQRVFRFIAGSNSDQTDTQVRVPFLTIPQTLTVERPFISAVIAVDGKTESITAPAGTKVQGTVEWQNNLTDSVSNLEIQLAFKGAVLDKNSIESFDGFYQSSDKAIIWTKAQVPSLESIPPGGSGVLHFAFTTVPPNSGGALYANPTVDLNVTVSAVRQGQDRVSGTVSSAASARVSIASLIGLTSQALHFSGSFVNAGPMPPVAEQSTTYTIVWTVNNSSNTIANTAVSSVLPPYVRFMSAEAGSGVEYSAASRTVTWVLGDVKPGAGYGAGARTAAFQVAFNPSTSQIGQSPALTGEARLTGQDRFAQVPVVASAVPPTTSLSTDSGFNNSMGQVVQKQ